MTVRTVSFAGVTGSVDVALAPEATVGDVFREAAAAFGVDLNPDNYDAVVDGEDAELTDEVGDAEQVDFAQPLANGCR